MARSRAHSLVRPCQRKQAINAGSTLEVRVWPGCLTGRDSLLYARAAYLYVARNRKRGASRPATTSTALGNAICPLFTPVYVLLPRVIMSRLAVVLLLAACCCSAVRLPGASRRAVCRGAAATTALLGGGRSVLAAAELRQGELRQGELIYTVVTPPTDPASPVPERGQKVAVDYSLWLVDFGGKLVDSSKGSAFPPKLPSPFVFSVGVGAVIPGWDKAVRTMRAGEKRRLVVPSTLAYGDKGIGPIPGGSTLYFEVELLELRSMPKWSEKQQEWLDTHPEP